ncbi:MauE/DoxX family redox-associated membrane protein [Flavobacterium sp. DG2-3]|uniref:MauE/DoxX family redox-associated membrane protein n=1 Tax=Flavobacterium sp. DG2-3 TaxID=3068317 RepID=UPI00273E3F46|nr:MauE/DoxX family redox-associated membrane protein [Flavobacterium sp. DG2-3]MDP5198996.1 MauE/DoxX family redox-associated membrane protein [Flavobacterium sp. DG2-3]
MKLRFNFKSVFIEAVSLLFVLLFVYAAISKFLDFENFQIQLGQSPLLSAYAFWVSWLVPIIELVIATALIIPKCRQVGLKASLGMMTMFTVYIFIILNYSSFVPCSCGGILEKMSWDTHLIFNIVFMILAIVAIITGSTLNREKRYGLFASKSYKWIAGILLFSSCIVIILFVSSEDIMHHENPFIRRYPQHPVVFSNAVDLKLNSYYLAGYNAHKIYLGNYTNPLHMESWDNSLKSNTIHTITFNPKKIPFKMVKISVQAPYFYLADGNVPAVFRGNVKDWKITKELKGAPYFTLLVPLDSITLAFRSNNAKKAANVLGIFNDQDMPKIKYSRDLLQRQIDGIFDTDGTLLYSEGLKKIVYLYYYRNEFIIADKTGKLDHRAHTIDTIEHVKIKVSALDNGSEYAMSAPPFVVNAHAAVCKNLLFVHSEVKGKFENNKLWEQSFIIDVYDLNKNTYIMSFPVYHTTNKKLNSFIVTPTHLYALIGNNLVVYELKEALKKEMKGN